MADEPSAAQGARSTTPENRPSLTQSGTPLVYRQSGSQPQATREKKRIDFYDLMAKEIDSKIVQDMDVKEFLDKFLPKPVSMMGVARLPSAVELAKVRNAKDEDAMYVPFVSAFDNFETVKLLDCHSKTFRQLPEAGADIKPDVVLSDDKSQTVVNISMADVGVTVEMKFPEDVDPFDLTKGNDKQKATLGQISAYTAAHMAAQFRTHVFSALVFPNFARLLRWDRAGAIVTKKISFATPESAADLAEFFQRYDCSSSLERGVDPYVTRFSELDFATFKIPEGAEDIKTALKPGKVKGSDNPITAYQKITFPEPIPTQTEPRSYVVAIPYYMGTISVVGRSTRTFKAYCLQDGKIVFLKDTWRILEKSTLPEHETYAKLAEAKVKNVATAIDYHDMERQETKTAFEAQTAQETKTAEFGKHASTFRSFRHYRLVLKEFARNIEEFKDVKELLTVFWNTIQAHNEACHKAKILHRDISSGNIMIHDGRGLLVDWDFSKPTGTTGPRSPERTGTWQFIAYRLAKARDNNELFPEHNVDDDLESFWYVLFWVALRRCEHGASEETISADLRVFDEAYSLNGVATALKQKISMLRDDHFINEYSFRSPPLVTTLTEFQSVVAVRYSLTPAQINTALSAWSEVLTNNPGASEDEKTNLLMNRVMKESFTPQLLPRASSARPLLDSQWAQNLFSNALTKTPQASWEEGGENKLRNLPTPFQRSKRKGRGEDDEGATGSKRICLESDLQRIPEDAV